MESSQLSLALPGSASLPWLTQSYRPESPSVTSRKGYGGPAALPGAGLLFGGQRYLRQKHLLSALRLGEEMSGQL